MNSFDMQKAFNHRFDTQQRYELVVPNVFVGSCEWDLLGVRKKSRYLDEIEIKISKSDFKADFKKTTIKKVPLPVTDTRRCGGYRHLPIDKHKCTKNGERLCNYFWFLLPDYLVDKCDIPEHAGLFVCIEHKSGFTVREVSRAKLLHKNKPSTEFLYKTARKSSYRYWDSLREK